MYVGIDVSKASLDVMHQSWKKSEKFANRNTGIRRLLKKLSGEPTALVVIESTGGYERLVAKSLDAAGIKVAVVNPMQTHNFAKVLNLRAKTDPIDAHLLATYAERMKPSPTTLLSDEAFQLQQLVKHRLDLVAQRTQAKNRLGHETGFVASSTKRVIKFLDKEIASAEGELAQQIKSSEAYADKAAQLQSASGVGLITAYSFCALLPELGQLNRKAVAALVGVAPYNQDSGGKTGQRSVSGGRRELRCVLYMATLTAIRSNPPIRAFYKQLVGRGKKKKVALVACMRKFLVCLNAMMRNKERWKSN